MNQQNTPAPPQKRYGTIMLAVAWLLIFAMLVAYFLDLEATQFNPNSDPETIRDEGRNHILLDPNRQDHYVLTGKINGLEVVLMLDTGATNVAVPEDMAADLGLVKGRESRVHTANGMARAYDTHIDVLQLGSIILRDVEADITPGMNGSGGVLLGMSALSRIDFAQKDGQLILSQ